MLKSFRIEFQRYKLIGEKALQQLSEKDLNFVPVTEANSIAMIVRHLEGNLKSRFTDFLTSDGEKPWRNRDSEFEKKVYSRDKVKDMWNNGWKVLEETLDYLSEEEFGQVIYIRGVELTVHEALTRANSHISYHVGQIVLLARIFKGGNWDWISIPNGESEIYNAYPTKEKKPY